MGEETAPVGSLLRYHKARGLQVQRSVHARLGTGLRCGPQWIAPTRTGHLAPPPESSYWIAKPKLHGPDPPLFYATGEDDLAVIAQHYDVPVLSVRWAGRWDSSVG